jgi:hypothetical protein
MSALKAKSAQPNARSKRPRAAHSEFLKRFHGEPRSQSSGFRGGGAKLPEVSAEETSAPVNLASAPKIEPSLRTLSRSRTSLVLAQTLVQRRAPGQPLLVAELKLSTALRGSRKVDGLTEAAYLFRLEVVKTSAHLKLEGFSLGPWQAERLDLEGGNIFVAEPLWAGFQALTGKLGGRIRFTDTARQCVLDFPWHTEALVPGPEPW